MMKDTTLAALGFAGLAVILTLSVWWKVYSYGQCRHMGGARVYCALSK